MKSLAGYLALGSVVALLACEGTEAPETQAPKLEGSALAEALADADVFLLDVRNPDELEELGTVEGYVNIPIDELEGRLDEVPKDRKILTA